MKFKQKRNLITHTQKLFKKVKIYIILYYLKSQTILRFFVQILIWLDYFNVYIFLDI